MAWPVIFCTLYAIGSDFTSIADHVVDRVNSFIVSRQWQCPDVWAVSQQHSAEECELGLNLALPDPHQELPGWFADVEAVVNFCTELHDLLHQDFVIGITDAHTGCSEDIIEIDSKRPDYDYLRRFIGVAPPTSEGS